MPYPPTGRVGRRTPSPDIANSYAAILCSPSRFTLCAPAGRSRVRGGLIKRAEHPKCSLEVAEQRAA